MTTATLDTPDVRDAAAVDAGDWPDRPLSHPTLADRADCFQVVYRQSALDAIHLHGQTRTDVELCGVLLGTGCRDDHGPYLLVEHAIPGTSAASRSTNVTFTADTWQQIQTVMDRDFPDKKMVGWYHTHPGFGIFLSGMDLFICDNFFNLPWQVAFVYDPLGGDEGNFVWRAGKPVREPVLLEDDVTPRSAAVALIPVDEALTGSDPTKPASEVLRRPGSDADSPGSSEYLRTGLDPIVLSAVDLPPDAAAALQSQAVELMARVRLLERRVKLLALGLLFLAVFVAVCVVTLTWTGLSATPPPPTMVQPPPGPVVAPNPHVGH